MVAVALLAVFAGACGGAHRVEPTDQRSQTFASSSQRSRIVSLAPSLTEIAYAVDCGPQLVADTSYDDYPRAARSLPHVADLVSVDLERLGTLHPTAVLALHDQEREASPIQTRLGVPVSYLPNRTLHDLFADINQIGIACETQRAAQALSHRLHAQIAASQARAAALSGRPRVLFLLDLPGFTAGGGTFLDDLIRLAGGTNVAGNLRTPYPNVSAEALLVMDPDVIVVAREAPLKGAVLTQEPWRSMRAVQQGRIVRPPSDDVLERNGPRLVQGLDWLVGAIHSGR